MPMYRPELETGIDAALRNAVRDIAHDTTPSRRKQPKKKIATKKRRKRRPRALPSESCP